MLSPNEAIKAFKKVYPDTEYYKINVTPKHYLFILGERDVIVDPVCVNKETGKVKGFIPPVDEPGLTPDSIKTIYEKEKKKQS